MKAEARGHGIGADDQDVIPFLLDTLTKNELWKSWKAEVRFPLSHNPDYYGWNVCRKDYMGYVWAETIPQGLKPPYFFALFGTTKVVP